MTVANEQRTRLHVLVVEDNESDCELMLRALRNDFDVHALRVHEERELDRALEEGWDVVLADYHLPRLDAMRVLALMRENSPDTPLIIVTGSVGEEVAAESIKRGASDYLLKDRLTRLPTAVKAALEERRLRDEKRRSDDLLRQRELELARAQKLEAIGRLAGGIAHDFNNDLTVILGYVELLLERLGPNDPTRRELAHIRTASEHAAQLTQGLLAFGRRQVMDPRPLDVNEPVRRVVRLLRRVIGEDIEVVTWCDENIARTIADAAQLERAIMNLAINARDAMPHGGRLAIETANVHVPAENDAVDVPTGDYVVIAVHDTGTGIAPDVRERIFEPFFTTKQEGKGTGLGLPAVLGIVEQSGGFLRLETEVGRGSVFRAYLPRAERLREERFDPPAIPRKSGGGAETLLVVEDEDSLREIVRVSLERLGYRVLHTNDPLRAIEMVRESGSSIDLAIIDLVMPGLSGLELASALQTNHPGLPVLFMSGYGGTTLTRLSELNLRGGFLAKPFTSAQLGAKVREILDVGPRVGG